MALTHVSGTRNAMANACVDIIDTGSTDTYGDLVIMTTGGAALVTMTWTTGTAFGAATGGTATMNSIPNGTATAGTAGLFKFQDRNNAEVFRGTVGTTGADLNLTSVTLSGGDTISISSFTYSASV